MAKQPVCVYLVYRPAFDYEESMDAHFVCATLEEADAIIAEVMEWMDRLAKRLPIYPDGGIDDPDAALWAAVNERRDAILAKVKWPYGLDSLKSDLPGGFREGEKVERGILEVRKLTIVTPRKRRERK